MTNRLMYSLKVKKITLRQCGRFIKKDLHPAAMPETLILFFGIIGRRKVFYRQRIPESARKKTVDMDILVTSRNGGRKIMQFIS